MEKGEKMGLKKSKSRKAELQLVRGLCVFVSSSPAHLLGLPGRGADHQGHLAWRVMAWGATCGTVPTSHGEHQVFGVYLGGKE